MTAILQYLYVKPVISFICVCLELLDMAGKILTVFRVLDVLSFMIAMWVLALFYKTLSACLTGLRVVLIFAWLKGFLLLVVAQKFAINIASQWGWIRAYRDLDTLERAQRVLSFLTLFELVVFSLLAYIVFSPLPFRTRLILGQLDESVVKLKKAYRRLIFGTVDSLIRLWDSQGKGCWHGKNMPIMNVQFDYASRRLSFMSNSSKTTSTTTTTTATCSEVGSSSGTGTDQVTPSFVPQPAPDMVSDLYLDGQQV
eukprot:TRINITY_DN1528_c0_g1_i8.p1 TRINITY_DN1528_c0_g1~~TRINITY_DN1528_c0_g1_i8.p1  ORF type:complete len:255 (-),score=70.32 TRINITY_DN1528_c0_g1_i8:116-880(-)